MPLTQVNSGLLESGAALANIGSGNITPAYLNTQAQYTGFKNKLINGNFDVWQRGTSSTTTAIYGTADRFYQVISGTVTIAQETTVVPAGSRYAIKWTTGANSSFGQIRQAIETANLIPLRGKAMIASALVQCTAGFSGNIVFECRYSNSSDAMTSLTTNVSISVATGQVTSSGYTRITGTFTVPSDAVGLYIGIVPTAVQNSGVTVYISQFQLEEGSTATSFDYRPYGTELALCQRYYYKTLANAAGGYAGWVVTGATTARGTGVFKVSMRATPTVTLYDAGSNAAGACTQSGIADNIAATAASISTENFSSVVRTSSTFNTSSIYPVVAGFEASAEL